MNYARQISGVLRSFRKTGESSIQIKLEWPDGAKEFPPFEMPSEAGRLYESIDPERPYAPARFCFPQIRVRKTEVERTRINRGA